MKTPESATDNNAGRKTPEACKDTNVLARTPEDIKKGLMCYRGKHPFAIGNCPSGCPYEKYGTSCRDMMNTDAIAYIQQLESRLAQVERERDAAVKDLSDRCMYCKHAINSMEEPPCKDCFQRSGNYPYSPMIRTNFEWRGPRPENTKEADSGGETTSASDA